MSDSLWPHGLQYARSVCLSSCPGVRPSSCPQIQWCHPSISSSAALLKSKYLNLSVSQVGSNSAYRFFMVLEVGYIFQWKKAAHGHSGMTSLLAFLGAHVPTSTLGFGGWGSPPGTTLVARAHTAGGAGGLPEPGAWAPSVWGSRAPGLAATAKLWTVRKNKGGPFTPGGAGCSGAWSQPPQGSNDKGALFTLILGFLAPRNQSSFHRYPYS